MTTTEAPKAEDNKEKEIAQDQEVKKYLEEATTLSNNLLQLYKDGQAKVKALGQSGAGLKEGPWKNLVDGGTGAANNNVLVYLQSEPLATLINTTSTSVLNSGYTVDNPVSIDYLYFETFTQHAVYIDKELKPKLEEIKTQNDASNVSLFQDNLLEIKEIIYRVLLTNAQVVKDIITITKSEINKPDSVIYKGSNSYGPFSTQEITSFNLPVDLLAIEPICIKIIDLIKELTSKLDSIINVPEDVLKRVILSNAGLTQNTEDSNTFDTVDIEEKDPWGIRFSYIKSITGQTYAKEQDVSRSNTTLTEEEKDTKEQSLVETNEQLLNSTVNQKRSFYFQLLPAIKSNLPVSGGSDVPGAMPGIQFRIENNIIKHKIPGFAPIYQPIGIDSIKCTLVGMFSGNDGVDISAAYSDDLNAGLLLDATELRDSVKKGNTSNPSFDKTNLDSNGLPIPSNNKSSTSSNVAVLSEDAFKGAQDFYNEVVVSGREVEVELNLRKSSGALEGGGGGVGPFRDPETGNPKFKGLIKRLDLYYVRRDRCWFIIDLEITNSGLIGTECINLTNIIEEATELFESVETKAALTKEDLDKCFTSPKEFKYKGDKSGIALVVDMDSGLSYEYNLTNNSLNTGTYPTSMLDTITILGTKYKEFKNNFGFIGSDKSAIALSYLIDIFTRATIPKINENVQGFNWAPNKLSIRKPGGFARYNKNNGQFYRTDKKGNLKELEPLGDFTKISSFVHFDEVQESINFFLSDYFSSVVLKKTSCETSSSSTDSVASETNTETTTTEKVSNNAEKENGENTNTSTNTSEAPTFTTNTTETEQNVSNILIPYTSEEFKEIADRISNGSDYTFLNRDFINYVEILSNQTLTADLDRVPLEISFDTKTKNSGIKIEGPSPISQAIKIKEGSAYALKEKSTSEYVFVQAELQVIKAPIKLITPTQETQLTINSVYFKIFKTEEYTLILEISIAGIT